LNASTALLLHYASALTRFSIHEANVREQMKSVRTREENLDELKRRRKGLVNKADTADKKLSRMSAENKNFQSQADSLNKLREEIRSMDTEVMNEEASLGDFKRATTKHWMATKFGALVECCGKGTVSKQAVMAQHRPNLLI
jgi:DNA repair exonuclease SbcCD ATPase subunit